MIKHPMDKVNKVINFLNPEQTAIIVADQPFLILAKQNQWEWPVCTEKKSLSSCLVDCTLKWLVLKFGVIYCAIVDEHVVSLKPILQHIEQHFFSCMFK